MRVYKSFIFLLMLFNFLFLYGGDRNTCFELLLIDSQGKKTGYNSANNKIIEDIPESSYGDIFIPNVEGEDIFSRKSLEVITPPKGSYILYIIGIDTGPYAVRMEARDKEGNSTTFITSGAITSGEIKKVFINYTPEVGGITEIFEDDTAPITTLKISQPKFYAFGTTYITPNTTLGFEAVDPVVGEGASGVKYTEYRIDDSSWVVYTTTFTLTKEGGHTIEYRSVDYVGNIEETKTKKLNISIISNYASVGVDKISLLGKVEVYGNIISNGRVDIKGDVFIDGDVYGSEVYISRNSTITGEVVEGAIKINSYPIDLVEITAEVLQNNDNTKIPKTKKGKTVLDKFGRLVLREKDELILPEGIYYFTGMILEGKSELKTEGKVSILCSGDIKVLGRVRVTSESPSDLVIFVSSEVLKDIDEESFELEKEDLDELVKYKEEFEDLELDRKGKICFKKPKHIKQPSVYILGKTELNCIIYAATSKVFIVGNNLYKGNMFSKELKVSGNNIIKSEYKVELEKTPVERQQDKEVKQQKTQLTTPADPTFKLNQAYIYPNPAKCKNPKIHIEVGIADEIEIKIYSISGNLVESTNIEGNNWSIINDRYCYEYEWDVRDISSGVYVCYILAKKQGCNPIKLTKKIVVVK